MHATPIPRVGGLAVFLAFGAAYLVYRGVLPVEDQLATGSMSACFLLACAAVMLIGLVDDIRGVRPVFKILVQVGAASCLYINGFRIGAISNPFADGPIELGIWGLPLTLFWFVVLSNAFNLIDGLDGLAAGVAFFATSAVSMASFINGRATTGLLAAALAGALVGFLRHNYNPARIFLGDSGSLFVGFALAGLSLRGSMKASAAIAVAVPLLVLAVPMLDVGVAVLRRTARGVHIFHADRDHIHHRLVRMGLTPRRAVLVLYGATAFTSALALMTMAGEAQAAFATLVLTLLGAWVLVRRLGYVEVTELEKALLRRFMPRSRQMPNNVMLRDLRAQLAEAETLADTWPMLGESLRRLGFAEMRLDLRDEYKRMKAEQLARRQRVASFPRMVLAGDEGRRSWSWSFEVKDGLGPIGELVLSWPSAEQQICFDTQLLAEAVAEALPKCLAEPGLEGTTRPSRLRLREPGWSI